MVRGERELRGEGWKQGERETVDTAERNTSKKRLCIGFQCKSFLSSKVGAGIKACELCLGWMSMSRLYLECSRLMGDQRIHITIQFVLRHLGEKQKTQLGRSFSLTTFLSSYTPEQSNIYFCDFTPSGAGDSAHNRKCLFTPPSSLKLSIT